MLIGEVKGTGRVEGVCPSRKTPNSQTDGQKFGRGCTGDTMLFVGVIYWCCRMAADGVFSVKPPEERRLGTGNCYDRQRQSPSFARCFRVCDFKGTEWARAPPTRRSRPALWSESRKLPWAARRKPLCQRAMVRRNFFTSPTGHQTGRGDSGSVRSYLAADKYVRAARRPSRVVYEFCGKGRSAVR